ARHAMNSWVASQTKGKIAELVPRGVITESTRLEATAAAYLEAPWDQRFDLSRSRPGPFQRPDGQTVSATMMELRAATGVLYGKDAGWQAVELPYLGRQLGMIVIIPDAGHLAEVEARLDGTLLQRIVQSLAPTALDLHLPRFGFTTQGELDDPLSEIGAPTPFISGEADFSGITADEALWIAGFSHQAFLSADEEGTESSAVTIVPAQAAPPPAKLTAVTADRPFLVMVIDRTTDEPLFLGRVVDPTS
ncbi:MAG TPA: serpin family protein, partial [Acidimicrobiales bacterium]